MRIKISGQQEVLEHSFFLALRKVWVCLAGLAKPRVRTRAGTGLLSRNPAFFPKTGGLIRFNKRLYPVISV